MSSRANPRLGSVLGSGDALGAQSRDEVGLQLTQTARHSRVATGAVLAGSLSKRALRLVREWTEQHRDDLDANWKRVVNNDQPESIEPLR